MEKELKDGTFKLINGLLKRQNLKSGYQVSFFNGMIEKNKKELLATRVMMQEKFGEYLGIYEGEMELSYRVPTKKEAIKIAKKYNQIAIWDNGKNRPILTK